MRAIEKVSKKYYEVINNMTEEDWNLWLLNREKNRQKRIEKLKAEAEKFVNRK